MGRGYLVSKPHGQPARFSASTCTTSAHVSVSIFAEQYSRAIAWMSLLVDVGFGGLHTHPARRLPVTSVRSRGVSDRWVRKSKVPVRVVGCGVDMTVETDRARPRCGNHHAVRAPPCPRCTRAATPTSCAFPERFLRLRSPDNGRRTLHVGLSRERLALPLARACRPRAQRSRARSRAGTRRVSRRADGSGYCGCAPSAAPAHFVPRRLGSFAAWPVRYTN